jgi:hypothetical protein
MRSSEFITERTLLKNSWELLISNADKEEFSSDLVKLVQHAYKKSSMGSFIKSKADVLPSDWNVIDWDDNEAVDACIFWRSNRPNENWQGIKIQGIGHDGRPESKNLLLSRLRTLLSQPGTWIEASDQLVYALEKAGVSPVTDEKLIQQVFKDPNIKLNTKAEYTRQLSSGTTVTEKMFGKPKVKKRTT